MYSTSNKYQVPAATTGTTVSLRFNFASDKGRTDTHERTLKTATHEKIRIDELA
jgi:hypothetical protein